MSVPKYNILYGMLTRGRVPASDPYYKRSTRVPATATAGRLALLLVPDTAGDRAGLMASAICAAVLDTGFGNDIAKLDPYNTYVMPKVDGAVGERPMLYDLTCSASALSELRGLLDQDIRERLVVAQWIDVVAAGCLQLLREVI